MRNLKLVAALVATLTSSFAHALPSFVGSWQVDQGPSWLDVPTAYTGQEAAALLFGGAASNYVISTVDSNAANIDFMTWVSVWGTGTDKVAQNFRVDTGGQYQLEGDTSAYVNDWAIGDSFTNFAFRVGDVITDDAPVPEPASCALMVAGFVAAGVQAQRKRRDGEGQRLYADAVAP